MTDVAKVDVVTQHVATLDTLHSRLSWIYDTILHTVNVGFSDPSKAREVLKRLCTALPEYYQEVQRMLTKAEAEAHRIRSDEAQRETVIP